jgi:hypothetical protein
MTKPLGASNADYIRIVEQVPELLTLNPREDLPLIIAIAYQLGIKDGMKMTTDVVDKMLKKLGA